jgi:hypothetical protein
MGEREQLPRNALDAMRDADRDTQDGIEREFRRQTKETLSRMAFDEAGHSPNAVEAQLAAEGRWIRKRMDDEPNEERRRAHQDSTMGSKRAFVLWLVGVSQLVVGGLVEALFHPLSRLLGH